MRVTSSVFWSHNGWDAGITSVFGGEYWVDTTNATLAPSRYTSSVTRWDFNAGYDFGHRGGFGGAGSVWWQRALRDTKWRATIIDAFNTEPPLDVRGYHDKGFEVIGISLENARITGKDIGGAMLRS